MRLLTFAIDWTLAGWVPLDMYRNAPMRSRKAARRDWPVPRQPEKGLDALFPSESEQHDDETADNLVVQV